MILRADNPYGTGHGADVPFTMGWYNNPGNSWNLETLLRLVIQSERSLQKFKRYLNWYFVELIHLIGNGEVIWIISIDWNTWKIFFMMDILTRPWFFNIILLANDSANQKLRNRPKHNWLPFLTENRNTLEFRNNDTHTWTNIIGNILNSLATQLAKYLWICWIESYVKTVERWTRWNPKMVDWRLSDSGEIKWKYHFLIPPFANDQPLCDSRIKINSENVSNWPNLVSDTISLRYLK